MARRQHFFVGLWLAAAVSLKVIPGFLALFPLIVNFRPQGDGIRGIVATFFGGTFGLLTLLIALPAMVWGFEGAVHENLVFVDAVLAPGALGTGNQDRAIELTNATATDSQSFQAVLHTWCYPDRPTRPTVVSGVIRAAHWLVGGLMAFSTVFVAALKLSNRACDRLIYLGCLTVVMILITPVSHMHYYAMVLPLVMGLWTKKLEANPEAVFVDVRTMLVLVSWTVLTLVPLLPGDEFTLLRDGGMATFATVGLWAYGLAQLWRRTP